MTDQKNTLLAIVLSAIVLIGWQLFFGAPQLARQKQIAEQQQQEQTKQPPGTQPATGTQPGVTPAPSAAPRPAQPSTVPSMTREAALALSPRVRIDTPLIGGSIALKGGRVDDISLLKFRETVDPNSPPIVLLAPSGSPQPFYSEFGWVAASGTTTKVPGNDTEWRQEGSSPLSIDRPVTLVYDNGEGLEFRRVISVDDKYLFTVKDTVANKTEAPVTLHPYALIARHGAPPTLGYYILHEGLIGVMGDQGLQELTYKKMDEAKGVTFEVTNAWLGITDKYWAAVLLPNTDAKVTAHFSAGSIDQTKTYQTDYLLGPDHGRPWRHRHRQCEAVRRRQGSVDRRRLQRCAQSQQVRPAHRLGLFLFPHQADVPRARLDLPACRQFRHRDSAHYRRRQDLVLPARQQVLRLDGEDEGGPAAAHRNPRTLRGRQSEAAAGDDGAVQEGEDQPGRRLPADDNSSPGVLLTLQGPVRHHRDAACAVLRLDPRPFGARSRPTSSPCSVSSPGSRRHCRSSAHSCISAPGRSSWASRCGRR